MPPRQPRKTNMAGAGMQLKPWYERGGWKKDSHKIPAMAWVWSSVVIGLFFAVAYIGAAAGF